MRVLFGYLLISQIICASGLAARETLEIPAILARGNEAFWDGKVTVKGARGLSPCIDFLARPFSRIKKGPLSRIYCALIGVTRSCTFQFHRRGGTRNLHEEVAIQLARGLYTEMGRLIDYHKDDEGVCGVRVNAHPTGITILTVQEASEEEKRNAIEPRPSIYRIEEMEVDFEVILLGAGKRELETRIFRRNLRVTKGNDDLVAEDGYFNYR